MKKLRFNAAALALIAALAACTNANTGSTTTKKDGKTTISINDNNTNAQLKHSGEIELNEDETAIVAISPKGYLNYSNNGKELLAESDASGVVAYTLREGSGKLDYNDPAGKKFVAQTLREMHSHGFNLEKRIDAIYKKNGTQAVLKEADNMRTDELKKNCYEYLLKTETLSSEDLAAVAEKISAMKSDHVKRDLLKKHAGIFMKDQSNGLGHLLNAAASITSDNQRAQVIENLANTGEKTEEQWIAIIDAAAKISATGEKTNVMIKIGEKAPRSEAVKAAYMKAAKTITADAEYARVVAIMK